MTLHVLVGLLVWMHLVFSCLGIVLLDLSACCVLLVWFGFVDLSVCFTLLWIVVIRKLRIFGFGVLGLCCPGFGNFGDFRCFRLFAVIC